jgi:hypothetical protein
MQNPLSYARCDLGLRRLSRQEGLMLGAIMLCALALYVALQHGRVFIGDEIGTLRYIKKSPGYILTHFATQLTMNYFILVEKGVAWVSGASDWRLTLLPMAASLAIIPLTASLTLKLTGSTRTALIAASLTAFNPYLVMWAPMIRSYSLLVALGLLAINEFFHWYLRRNWLSGVRCAGAVLLLLLAHLNGIYTVVFLIFLLLIETVSAGGTGLRKFVWESRTLWIPLGVAAATITAAYWRLLPDIAKVNGEWGTDTPPTSLGYLPGVFRTYIGIGYVALLSAMLLIAGCGSALREKRALLLLCVGVILGPILMSLQGVSVPTWTYARYLVFSVPMLLILMAEGIGWIARHVRIWGSGAVVAWCLTAMILWFWTPNLSAQFVAKRNRPYARAAEFLRAQMQKGDVIVAGWSLGFTLSQFFEDPDAEIKLPGKYVSSVATQLDSKVGSVFYVTWPGALHGRKAPVHRFGQIEVTTYQGATARALLRKWQEDLVRRTAARVVPSFQGDYQLLALIEELIPSGQSPDHWRSLAEHCRAQNPAQREIPRHLRKATESVKFP